MSNKLPWDRVSALLSDAFWANLDAYSPEVGGCLEGEELDAWRDASKADYDSRRAQTLSAAGWTEAEAQEEEDQEAEDFYAALTQDPEPFLQFIHDDDPEPEVE